MIWWLEDQEGTKGGFWVRLTDGCGGSLELFLKIRL